MSLPTIYNIFNDVGKPLGTMNTAIRSWFPLSRKSNQYEFDCEVAELLVTDLAPYCAGKQENHKPMFTLEEVASVESVGGKVTRNEFPECLQKYVTRQQKLLTVLAEDNSDGIDEVKKHFEQLIVQAADLITVFQDISAQKTSAEKPAMTAKSAIQRSKTP